MSPWLPLFSVLSPPGEHGRLSVLIFHRILPEPDGLNPDEPDAVRFDQMLGWIKSWFNVLPPEEAVSRLRQGTLPSRAAAITFDDGYADNYTVALPILRKHGLSAAFFIATGFLDGGRMWNDTIIETVRHAGSDLDLRSLGLGHHVTDSLQAKRQALRALLNVVKYLPAVQREITVSAIKDHAADPIRDDLMMTSDQVCLMRRAGMVVGAHTVTHPILLGIEADQVRREIGASKDRLESLLREPVRFFAYPNGKPGVDYGVRDVHILREMGIEAAFSTAWGSARTGGDLLQIPRFTPWDRPRARFAARMIWNLWNSRGEQSGTGSEG